MDGGHSWIVGAVVAAEVWRRGGGGGKRAATTATATATATALTAAVVPVAAVESERLRTARGAVSGALWAVGACAGWLAKGGFGGWARA
jgi:hypothetical protein